MNTLRLVIATFSWAGVLTAALPNAEAATLYISDLFGAQTWNYTNAVWSTTGGGPYNKTWVDGSDAILAGGLSSVNVAGTIASVNSLTFVGAGHQLNGGTITLTGSGGDIEVDNGSDTINATIAGTVGLTKVGPATLYLAGTNTFSGDTQINGGAIYLTNSLALQYSTFNTSGAGSLQLNNLASATLGGIEGGSDLSMNSGLAPYPTPLTVGNNNQSTTYSGAIHGFNYVGSATLTKVGTGTLTLTGANNYSGSTTISAGTLQFMGTGSLTNQGNVYVGSGSSSGTLNINEGGAVSVAGVSINSQSYLVMDIGNGSSLLVGNGTGTLTNNGTVRLLAGADVAAGGVYSPITATTWSGSGTYQTLGGTWNSTNHQFTASAVQTGTAGQQLTIDLENEQRALVSDSVTGWSVGASFLSSTTSKPLTLTATTIGGSTFASLQSLLSPQQSILGGWQFAFTSGYAQGDPAYLSFDVGSGYSRNGLEVWHFDGSSWTPFTANDLTYDGTYANFTVTGFSGYAVTTIPEPGSITLLGMAALTILACAWRRRTKAS
jgi:autotransporter-associated beta strand protein